MNCPRCTNTLTKVVANDIEVDACFNGCGGIWFDWFEFKKLDEVHEADEDFLCKLATESSDPVEPSGKIECPKCDGITLMTFFHSANQKVEIDHCASCGGHWLDGGELVNIHQTTPNDEANKMAFEKMYTSEVEPLINRMNNESIESAEKTKRIRSLFGFITPSTWFKK